MLSLDEITQARAFLADKIRTTPVEFSPELSQLLGVEVYLKLEHLQLTGSFKIRGTYYTLSHLDSKEVITCSTGNHGKALAFVARKLGIHARIFVPKQIDEAKLAGILASGAEVIRSEHIGYDETKEEALEETKKTGIPFISAYDHPQIMAGNGGTLAAELLEQLPDTRTVYIPVGGGGLIAGHSFYFSEKAPQVEAIGCQHRDSAGLKLSLEQGRAVSLPGIKTFAGGIQGGLGANCFEVLKARVSKVALASEEEIWEGVRWMIRHHQYLIEPSAAVGIGAALAGRLPPPSGPAVFLLTGRNVSFETLKVILS